MMKHAIACILIDQGCSSHLASRRPTTASAERLRPPRHETAMGRRAGWVALCMFATVFAACGQGPTTQERAQSSASSLVRPTPTTSPMAGTCLGRASDQTRTIPSTRIRIFRRPWTI